MKEVSRQYEQQQKWVAEGKCQRCGADREHYAFHCDPCQVKITKRRRKVLKFKPWKVGGRGRPPKNRPEESL